MLSNSMLKMLFGITKLRSFAAHLYLSSGTMPVIVLQNIQRWQYPHNANRTVHQGS